MFSRYSSMGLSGRVRECLGWAMLLLFIMGTPAFAHAVLTATTPGDGVVLHEFPRQATLVFSEPVSPLVVRLVLPDASTQELTDFESADNRLSIKLAAPAMPGTYVLSWRVVSADGHPVGGAITFSLGVAAAAAAAADIGLADSGPLRQIMIWLMRSVLYSALFFGVGGAVVRSCAPGADVAGATRRCRQAVWVGLVAAPVSLMLQGLDALNVPWDEAFSPSVWQAAWGTTYSISVLLAMLALVGAHFALRGTSFARVCVMAVASVLLLGIAFAYSGHASVAPPQWLARPAVLVHTIAIALWLGSLPPLLFLSRYKAAQLACALSWFSLHIRWVVFALLVSGLLLVWLQIDRMASLWSTAYGQVLMVKLAFVAGLLLLAAWNRYGLTARVLAGNNGARRALVRTIKLEILLVFCIFGVVSLWRFTPPPRASSVVQSANSPINMHFSNSRASADVVITQSARKQPAVLQLALTDASSVPLHPVAVGVFFDNAQLGIEPIRKNALQVGPGQWEVANIHLPRGPGWHIRVDIFISDFDRIRLQGELPPLDFPVSSYETTHSEKQ